MPETVRDGSEDGPGAIHEELVEELRDRVAYLERQVEEEREARRRADTILAQLSQANAEQARTIRALEAPASSAATPSESDPLQSPESPGPSPTPPDRGEEPESATDEHQGRGPIPRLQAHKAPQGARKRSVGSGPGCWVPKPRSRRPGLTYREISISTCSCSIYVQIHAKLLFATMQVDARNTLMRSRGPARNALPDRRMAHRTGAMQDPGFRLPGIPF
jgi:hypothetical protein